jgi:hypothetical protein
VRWVTLPRYRQNLESVCVMVRAGERGSEQETQHILELGKDAQANRVVEKFFSRLK